MNCTQCGISLPEAGHFCHACGHDMTAADGATRRYAVKPDEPVRSFRIVSTIMPRGAAERPRTYQIAFGIALIAALLSAALGAVPVALMVAAFAVPVVYIVYLYDVNLWEDEPIPVTGLAFLLTFGLALAFTWAWTSVRGPLASAAALPIDAKAMPTASGVLLMALLVPVVGEILRQVGPVILASRPEFDDLMDGLTFGVISGVAFATADTLVKNWSLFGDGFQTPGIGSLTWVSLMGLEGFIKPLVIGTATGIACAEYSGLGEGYDGFTKRYVLATVEAIGWNVLYFGGAYLLSFVVPGWLGLVLTIAWGLLLLVGLVLRARGVLQIGLVEAALEYAARHDAKVGVGAKGRLEHCHTCEMPLIPHASFCSHCGQALRAATKQHTTMTAPAAAMATAGVPAANAEASAASESAPAPGDAVPAEVPPMPQPTEADARFDDEEGRA